MLTVHFQLEEIHQKVYIFSSAPIKVHIKDRVTVAGIEKRVFPHLLRHTFATHALNKGMPLESLCDLMGHASIETTRIYAKNHMSKIQYEYDRYAS